MQDECVRFAYSGFSTENHVVYGLSVTLENKHKIPEKRCDNSDYIRTV